MSDQDLEICRRLDQEYERALEEREVGYNARYNSVRQSAGFSIAFMVGYMTLGTIFFTHVVSGNCTKLSFFLSTRLRQWDMGRTNCPIRQAFKCIVFFTFLSALLR